MLAGEERRAFWDILRDNNVFVFCLRKQLHFILFYFIFLAKAFSFILKNLGESNFAFSMCE
jgi:hypothetical protein